MYSPVKDQQLHRRLAAVALLVSVMIAALLAGATPHINCWPTDSCATYVPSAAKLFEHRWLSSIHDIPTVNLNRFNMRMKEAFVLAIAVAQRVLGDTHSLYPNILVLIVAVAVAAVLMYLIIARLWGPIPAFVGYVLFATCLWPYTYVLMGAHQPFVLANFLAVMFLLLHSGRRKLLYLFSGIMMGIMLFSSPTSFLYLPYVLTGFVWIVHRHYRKDAGGWALTGFAGIFLSGAALTVLVFLMPDPLGNISKFMQYLGLSQTGNHFGYYHEYLSRFMEVPRPFRGGGWIWVLRYALLVIPVLFVFYAACIIYLALESIIRRRISLMFLIGISLSTPLMVEASGVSQFGRNYFSWLPGMVLLIAFAVRHFLDRGPAAVSLKRIFLPGLIVVMAAHAVFGLTVFLGDVLPARMATTRLDDWLIQHGVDHVLVYQNHFNNTFVADVLNNPQRSQKIKFYGIENLKGIRHEYVLVAPISGNNIWNDCSRDDFDGDPYLTRLITSGEIDRYAAASFDPIISSPVWNSEEEVCAYRDLMLGQISSDKQRRNKIYILDTDKLPQKIRGGPGGKT